jgi:hypothetical protein
MDTDAEQLDGWLSSMMHEEGKINEELDAFMQLSSQFNREAPDLGTVETFESSLPPFEEVSTSANLRPTRLLFPSTTANQQEEPNTLWPFAHPRPSLCEVLVYESSPS